MQVYSFSKPKIETQNYAQQIVKFAQQQIESLMRETLLKIHMNVHLKGYAVVRQAKPCHQQSAATGC